MSATDFRRSIEAKDGWIALECDDGESAWLTVILPGTTVGIVLESDEIKALISVLLEVQDLISS